MPDFFSLLDWKSVTATEGRENLGDSLPVLVYRLMQYGLHDHLAKLFSPEIAHDVLRGAGALAGKALSENLLDASLPFSQFISSLQKTLKDLKIGILRMEESDLENGNFTMTVSEDLDCSGLPMLGETICYYDEGFIAGALEAYTGKQFLVKETDCWATGDRVCRFHASIVNS